jgi:hypothetical protein
LTALQTAFEAATNASAMGGQMTTAVKNQCRTELLSALRRQASYVQGVCQQDEAGMLSSGFQSVSQNRSPRPLERPRILKVLHEGTEMLTLRVAPVGTARLYEVQRRVSGGEWEAAGTFQQSRRMEIGGLTPGVLYDLRVRALGGSTGHSDWSDALSCRSL